MPELPEVETVCRGISPHLLHRPVTAIIVRDGRLRWPVPENLGSLIRDSGNNRVSRVSRRGKYLLIQFGHGCLIVHLGMSGSLKIVPDETPPTKHDHVDILLDSGYRLRFTDSRRFGSIHWTEDDPLIHPLLSPLGPEPLHGDFDGEYLYKLSRRRKAAVKNLIMDSRIVAGIGNIYANEALFAGGILPARQAGRIARHRYEQLVESIKQVLTGAIEKGGTTLRDFVNSSGRPGYFQQQLNVYARAGLPCRNCGNLIRSHAINNRASYYCTKCQR